jgi:hypothetical protein
MARPTGNARGNYYFFSLSTGCINNRMHATKLSMRDNVIERVHGIARRQKANSGLVFMDRNQVPDICKHKSFLASMFYQNNGPSSVHVFHISRVYFSSKKPVIFCMLIA